MCPRREMLRTWPVVATCFMALFFSPAWAQEKPAPKETTARGQFFPPSGEQPRVSFEDLPATDRLVSTDSTPRLFGEREPFPPKGFAEGWIVTLGDDSGEPGTYRIAFKWKVNGQEFPLIECRQLQALEDKLLTFGRSARHGKLLVAVKGTVTLYRNMNFLLLSEFRIPLEGSSKKGGLPAAAGGLKDLQ